MKLLFQANYSDGTFYQQTHEDVSLTVPTKSAFYDVLQRQDDIISFGLFSDETPDTYAVDLTDGHFEINGRPFTVQNPSEPLELAKRRLIYFRQVSKAFGIGDFTQCTETIVFHIGWQALDSSGRNHQYTIAVG